MQELRTDLAVVAAGPAGLAAAVAASEAGVKVCVFEKAAVPGGAARMGMGPFGVESRIQKRSMVGLKKEDVFRRFMDYTQWKADAALVRNYFWKSGSTIDWLEDMGVPFWGVGRYVPEAEDTWHQVRHPNSELPIPGAGAVMADVMMARAKELGAQFYMKTPVVRLLRDDSGVCGLEARDEQGELIRVKAGAVVVATGGFGDNPEMIQEECGFTYDEDIFNNRVPGVTGDGLRMAWEVGAAKSETTMELILHSGIPRRFYKGSALFRQPGALVVGRRGQRLMNEELLQNTAVSANIIKAQPNKRAFAILTDEVVAYYKQHGLDFPHFSPGSAGELDTFEEGFQKAREKYPDCAFIAGSLEELAEQMGIDPHRLKQTVEVYNQCCADHFDDYMCKERRYLHPITGKVFYGERVALGAYGSLGGIAVDADLEVLDDSDEPIPGFYGAGSDVCNIYAGTYMFYLPGNTMGFALNSGRMAGEHAAQFLKESGRLCSQED